jgi:hypothetical protein
MNEDQIRHIVEEIFRNTAAQEWWFTTLFTMILMAMMGAVGAYFGAYLRQKGQYSAVKQGIQNVTRLAKEIEQQITSRSAFLDKILIERFELIRGINKRLEFVRYNYERIRKDQEHDLRINRHGETLDITELLQMLELNRALLGPFYIPLRQKYDQLLILYKKDLNWDNEMETWNRSSRHVQELMEETFRFCEARLPR